jgi:hypothetical protein
LRALGGWAFSYERVTPVTNPLGVRDHDGTCRTGPVRQRSLALASNGLQGYLALKKTPTTLGPPEGPRHGPTIGSWGGVVSYARGTLVTNPFGARDHCWTCQTGLCKRCQKHRHVERPTLETTQGQMDGFSSQLPFKYYLPEVASVGD